MLKFRCHGCDRKLAAPAKYAGRVIDCPTCKARNVIPDPDDPEHQERSQEIYDQKVDMVKLWWQQGQVTDDQFQDAMTRVCELPWGFPDEDVEILDDSPAGRAP